MWGEKAIRFSGLWLPEIISAIGAWDALVGRSHECDNPEWVQNLPVCTRRALDVTCSSRDIADQQWEPDIEGSST